MEESKINNHIVPSKDLLKYPRKFLFIYFFGILMTGAIFGFIASTLVIDKKIETMKIVNGIKEGQDINESVESQKISKMGNEIPNSNYSVNDFKIYSAYLDVRSHPLSFVDEKCGVKVTFPQITLTEEKVNLWFVDASNERTFISYTGRNEPSSELDNSLLIYTKEPNYVGIYYASQIMLVCAKNSDDLNLATFVDKFIENLKTNVDPNLPTYVSKNAYVNGEKTINGYKFVRIFTEQTQNNLYLGLVKGNLYLIDYNDKEGVEMNKEAEEVVNNLVFL